LSREGNALSAVLTNKPDILLTDIEMPEMTGLEVAADLKRRRLTTRVIILTTFARAGYLPRALDAGIAGYLLKDMAVEKHADAVRRVQSGLRVIDPELAAEAWAEPDPLTDREHQVLRLTGNGMASFDIAGKLNLSEGTVRNYLSEAISKLGAANRVDAARIARTKGCLQTTDRETRPSLAASRLALRDFEAETLKHFRSFFAAKIKCKLYCQFLALG
jgi:two-component system response regulator DesR